MDSLWPNTYVDTCSSNQKIYRESGNMLVPCVVKEARAIFLVQVNLTGGRQSTGRLNSLQGRLFKYNIL